MNLLLLLPAETLAASIPGTNDFMAASECLHRPALPHQPERKNTTGWLQEPELGIPGMSCGNVQQRRQYFPIPSM